MKRTSAQSDNDEQLEQEGKGKDRQFVTALARGLQILRCFTRAQPALRASELARMTGLPQPTVWRLCYTLIQEGYLVHVDGGEKLRPNYPVLALGYAAIAGAPIAELARPEMEELANRYQGAVTLGVRDGMHIIYLARSQRSDILIRNADVGSRVPLVSAPIAWGYIAGLDPEGRKGVLAEFSRSREARWPELQPKLKKALVDYEKLGYVVSKGILHEQINAVAVPVFAEDGSVAMSLSCGGLAPMFPDKRLAAIGKDLKALADRLSSAIKSTH
ncbi:MAG: IclR family transcriptional regulator [Pigmentiphaga sp.]|uniref:IclR family transcriptional regulator n=1 Tax=Pigmentiphaga sp. TaxID=1977564 RepID=UPI0029AC1F80|nr:IclR family transcriptional regulator [Pigmentiphaga sp.]MDX3907635.1 IclR family transcriptional regulator [Pigmentiphaga sp.]